MGTRTMHERVTAWCMRNGHPLLEDVADLIFSPFHSVYAFKLECKHFVSTWVTRTTPLDIGRLTKESD